MFALGITKSSAEDYYVQFTSTLDKYVKMIEGDVPGEYYTYIPARYPLTTMRNNTYQDKRKNESVEGTNMNSFASALLYEADALKKKNGISFCVAPASLLAKTKDQYGNESSNLGSSIEFAYNAISSEDKKKLLGPSHNSSDNMLVSSKTTMTGKLGTFDQSACWEIAISKNDLTTSDFHYEHEHVTENNQDYWRSYTVINDDVALDGSYKFTINPSLGTWKLEYIDNKRVSYLVVQPNNNKATTYDAYSTYLLWDIKGDDGRYNNYYVNPYVFFNVTDKYQYLFLDNCTESYDFHEAAKKLFNDNTVIGYTTEDKKDTVSTKDASHAVPVYHSWYHNLKASVKNAYSDDMFENGFQWRGPSDKGEKIDEICGYGHTMDLNHAGQFTNFEHGGYYNVTFYPHMGKCSDGMNSQGIIKVFDAENAEDEKNGILTNVYIESYSDGNVTSALKDKTKTEYELKSSASADGVYTLTLSPEEFGNGHFYFKAKTAAKSEVKFGEDSKIVTKPTKNNPNVNIVVASNDKVVPDYYDGASDADKDIEYVIYLTMTSPTTCEYYIVKQTKTATSKNLTLYPAGGWYKETSTKGTYKYVMVGDDKSKPKMGGEFLRTWSSDICYDVDSKECRAYIVTNMAIDSTTTKGSKLLNITLKQLDYIPANTGVILRGNSQSRKEATYDFGGKKYISKSLGVTLKPKTVDGKENGEVLKTTYDGSKGYNWLIPSVSGMTVSASTFAVSGDIEKRYFFLNEWRSSTLNPNRSTSSNPYYTTEDNYFGFFRAMDNSYLEANKAYLYLSAETYDGNIQLPVINNLNEESTAKGMRMIFIDSEEEDDNVTGISDITASHTNIVDEAYYTLTGIKVQNPTKGIFIHHGKKVVIK